MARLTLGRKSVILMAFWGLSSTALADEADESCRLSARTCASEGIVVIASNADRRLVEWWRSEIDFRPIDVRWFRPWFFDALGPDQTITLLVGSEDLDSIQIDDLAQEIYARGGSVILTDATLDDADRLDQLVGASGVAWVDDEPARLYGVRVAFGDDDRRHPMAFVLLQDRAGKLDQSETAWLLARIGRNPPVLQRTAEPFAVNATSTACDDDPQSCINQLAQATHTSVKKSANGDTFEEDNFIYGARSFVNEQDYYYVDQQLQFSVCDETQVGFSVLIGGGDNTPETKVHSTISPSPGSTQSTTTVTSSVNFGITGKAGYSYSETDSSPSFDVSPSLAISNSMTTTVPPFDISNETNVATGVTEWEFASAPDTAVAGQDTVFNTSWIWAVNYLSAYQSNTAQFVFDSKPVMATLCNQNDGISATLVNKIDQPFDSTTIETPAVRLVTPDSVASSQKVDVIGRGFYPSLMKAVLLGGQTLDTGNWSADSDKLITVTAPAKPPAFNTPLAVEVKTSEGVSNTNHDVTITD